MIKPDLRPEGQTRHFTPQRHQHHRPCRGGSGVESGVDLGLSQGCFGRFQFDSVSRKRLAKIWLKAKAKWVGCSWICELETVLKFAKCAIGEGEFKGTHLKGVCLSTFTVPLPNNFLSIDGTTRLSSRQSAAGSVHRQDSTCPNPPIPQSAMCPRYH